MAKATHHQRGAFASITPAMRSVIQLKFRLFKTSGIRINGFSAEADVSPSITSGAVVAPSIYYLPFLLRIRGGIVVLGLLVAFVPEARHSDAAGVGHFRIRI